jgi:hypothetical protein
VGGKLLALALILALTVALAACGSDEPTAGGAEAGRPSSGPAARGS